MEEFLRSNMDLPWNYEALTEKVSLEFIKEFPDKPWNYHALTDKVDIEFIKEYPNKPWNSSYLSYILPLSFVLENMDLPWNWRNLSFSSVKDFQKVLDNINLQWDWEAINWGISHNGHTNFDIDFVINNPNLPWDIAIVSHLITSENIQKAIDSNFPFEWWRLCYDPKISCKLIDKYHYKCFPSDIIPYCKDITFNFIKKYKGNFVEQNWIKLIKSYNEYLYLSDIYNKYVKDSVSKYTIPDDIKRVIINFLLDCF